MPYALHTLSAPGTIVAGYRAGDEVSDAVIENWGLVEGEDFTADRPTGDSPAPVVPRPVDDADRGAWVAYAVSRGTDPAEAEEMGLPELMELHAEDEPAADPERPADDAVKAEWVKYVLGRRADERWATSSSTTKADLQAWQPEPGDTVAMAATEATQEG